jgi:ligand-binding sensor domain-containing protein
MLIIKNFIVIIIFSIAQILVAQNDWMVFDYLNSPLNENNVLALKHDKNNNVWIGTEYGLMKFDGYFWNLYNTFNSDLPSDIVNTLVNDKHNNLWFIVNADNFPYFVKYDGNSWIKTDTNQTCLGTIDNKYSFAVDEYEVKWVVGRKVGENLSVVRFSEDSCTSYFTELQELNATDLTIDHNNHFWFSVDWWDPHTGVAKCDYSQWKYSQWWSVVLAVDTFYNEAWCSSASSVYKLDFNNLSWLATYPLPLPWLQYNVWKLYPDKNYNLWCRSTEYGIFKFDRTSTVYTLYNESNSSLTSDTVNSIAIDDFDNVWIATRYGLAVLNESGINFLPSISNKDTLDFGEVFINDTLSLSFIITNPLTTNIKIDSVDISSSRFTSNYTIPAIIEPDSGYEFTVKFFPDTTIEYRSKLTLHTDKGMKSIMLIGVGEDQSSIYNEIERLNNFELMQNYPNPFNPTTKIKYQIPELIFVTLKVYDVLGNEVASLVNEAKPPGIYAVEFSGSGLTSGIYFYQLNAGDFSSTKKAILLK